MPEYTILRLCQFHGETEFAVENPNTKNQRTRCKKCRVEFVCRRRRELKLKAVNYKGGKCNRCGYDKCVTALDFHHSDPDKKEFSISKSGHTYSWEKMKKELDKCELLCANCHREEHFNIEDYTFQKRTNKCLFCDKKTTSLKSKYCDNVCKRKHYKNKMTSD